MKFYVIYVIFQKTMRNLCNLIGNFMEFMYFYVFMHFCCKLANVANCIFLRYFFASKATVEEFFGKYQVCVLHVDVLRPALILALQ